MDGFELHEVVWNPAKVARFWDAVSRESSGDADYFSHQLGRGITRLLGALGALEGEVLDFGCGPGHLVAHLLAAGVRCAGIDVSADSVARANDRFRGQSGWLGAQVLKGRMKDNFPEPLFDRILLVETLEHLTDAEADAALDRIRSLLRKPDGHLFLSTPYREELARSTVVCPDCGGQFHRYQHLRSFSRSSLVQFMEARGFETVVCDSTELMRFQEDFHWSITTWNLRYLAKWGLRLACRGIDWAVPPPPLTGGTSYRIRVGDGPHLFWLGKPSK